MKHRHHQEAALVNAEDQTWSYAHAHMLFLPIVASKNRTVNYRNWGHGSHLLHGVTRFIGHEGALH